MSEWKLIESCNVPDGEPVQVYGLDGAGRQYDGPARKDGKYWIKIKSGFVNMLVYPTHWKTELDPPKEPAE